VKLKLIKSLTVEYSGVGENRAAFHVPGCCNTELSGAARILGAQCI